MPQPLKRAIAMRFLVKVFVWVVLSNGIHMTPARFPRRTLHCNKMINVIPTVSVFDAVAGIFCNFDPPLQAQSADAFSHRQINYVILLCPLLLQMFNGSRLENWHHQQLIVMLSIPAICITVEDLISIIFSQFYRNLAKMCTTFRRKPDKCMCYST